MPGKEGDPGRTAENSRLCVNAVLFVLKTSIPWDDLPARYDKSNSVWKRGGCWCEIGIWQKLNRVLGNPDLEEVRFDSTGVKAHPVASTSRRMPGERKKR